MKNTMEDTVISNEIIRKPKDPILIVEDTKEAQDLLQDLCEELGLKTVVADNGQVALELLDEQSFSVFIVDLMMPVMAGPKFIHKLKQKNPNAVIIVQTGLDNSDIIINIMKQGVFDYIIKPIDPDIFQKTIVRSLEYKYLKDMEEFHSLNSAKKIRNQMDWLLYKESKNREKKNFAEIQSVYSLRTSMLQGAGIAGLITMLDLLKQSKKEDGEYYLIEKEQMDFVFENYDYFRTQIDGLGAIVDVLENNFVFERADASSLIAEIPKTLKNILEYFDIKNIKITYPVLKQNCNLYINKEKVLQAIEEMVINAYKYTIRNTTINLFANIVNGYFCISVKNDIEEAGIISHEDEKLVIEPFYRILPPDELVSKIERFPLGLGLTVVDNIAVKHRGAFSIKTEKDFTTGDMKYCVTADMMLPVY